ncbi:helix-turn-helix domain-containing protein [Eubacterium maltosivorans]|uniref:helix-turn-helix domain-containing protein n=1 Tax=Eubacterium maltosivorans TaxID=2041044 RepID=UPI0018A0530D|nr:helix-turn-helix transcriptional regulator [Eubacterium maltosivorans]
MNEIINRILNLIDERNMTGKELGKLLNLKKSPLTDWKNNKSKPTLEQIMRLCDIFAVSPNFLLFGEDDSKTTDIGFSLSTEEKEIITQWRKLSYEDKVILKGDLYKLLRDKTSSYEYENFMVAE